MCCLDTPPEKGATPAATTDPPVSPPAVPEQNKVTKLHITVL